MLQKWIYFWGIRWLWRFYGYGGYGGYVVMVVMAVIWLWRLCGLGCDKFEVGLVMAQLWVSPSVGHRDRRACYLL